MTYDVAIIGGGISGLATAYSLQLQGYCVVVLERQQQVGGNAISQNINGFLMEHGPSTLNAMVPQARQLATELGLDDQQIELGHGVTKRYLRNGDKLHGISTSRAGFLLSPYLSVGGRLSLLTEIFRSKKTDTEDETVHAFVSRRFGREFADKVMAPLTAGMFGGDAKNMSVAAVFPTLLEMEQRHGSITRGIIRAKRNSEPAKRLFSFKKGVASLPLALAGALGTSIQTGVAVKSLNHRENGYEIQTHRHGNVLAKSVVLAVQPHVVAQLMEKLDEPSATVTAQIDAPPMSVVFLGFHRSQVAHPLDSLGYMSLQNTSGVITGAQFSSTMFAGRAPKGFVSIAAYVGGVGNRTAAGLPAKELTEIVQNELQALLQIKGQPVLSRCRQWVRSLPQYELGHLKKVAVLNSLAERHHGLYLTGNYLAGVSMASCIGQARTTAQRVGRFLQEVAELPPEKVSAG